MKLKVGMNTITLKEMEKLHVIKLDFINLAVIYIQLKELYNMIELGRSYIKVKIEHEHEINTLPVDIHRVIDNLIHNEYEELAEKVAGIEKKILIEIQELNS